VCVESLGHRVFPTTLWLLLEKTRNISVGGGTVAQENLSMEILGF